MSEGYNCMFRSANGILLSLILNLKTKIREYKNLKIKLLNFIC